MQYSSTSTTVQFGSEVVRHEGFLQYSNSATTQNVPGGFYFCELCMSLRFYFFFKIRTVRPTSYVFYLELTSRSLEFTDMYGPTRSSPPANYALTGLSGPEIGAAHWAPSLQSAFASASRPKIDPLAHVFRRCRLVCVAQKWFQTLKVKYMNGRAQQKLESHTSTPHNNAKHNHRHHVKKNRRAAAVHTTSDAYGTHAPLLCAAFNLS